MSQLPTSDGLQALFSGKGTSVASGSNAPFLLEDPSSAWLVTEGRVDVFAVRVVDEDPQGHRTYLFTLLAGEMALGAEPEWADEVGILAVGSPGAVVWRLPVEELRRRDGDPELLRALERYVVAFSSALSSRSSPRFDILLSHGEVLEPSQGSVISSRKGVAWVALQDGGLDFGSEDAVRVHPEDGPFPLPAGAWVRCAGTPSLRVSAGAELEPEELWRGVRTFQRIGLEWADLVRERDGARERNRLGHRLASDREARHQALQALAGVISPGQTEAREISGNALLTACRVAGEGLGLAFKPAPSWERTRGSLQDELRAICRTSSVGYRLVILDREWWTRDNGPLLGFTSAEGEENKAPSPTPVALVGEGAGRYHIHDPQSGAAQPVTEELAQTLEPLAFQFYRGLPPNRVSPGDLWRFVIFNAWGDLRVLLSVGAMGAALGLLLPILTGVVFDSVIPSADRTHLVSVFAALAVAALAGAAFTFTRALAVLRLRTRASADLQMAVLDRLLRLPLPFFRDFTAGDLGVRVSGVSRIGNALSGVSISSVLSFVTSLGSYLLLYYYSVELALLATLLLLVNGSFTSVTAYLSLRYAREAQEVEGRVSGLVLQFLTGIAKLRVSGSEARAFSLWATAFRRQREMSFRVGRFSNHVQVFNSVLSIISVMLVYWAYTALETGEGGGITTGQFLAFNAAFGTFMTSGMALMSTGIELLALIPTWERARPVLDAEPEAHCDMPDPGELTGRLEVSKLTFQYGPDTPPVLQDVSLHAEPGETIAVVGPSGAGKSTLLRVLLGFERPETSSVYYDGHDLATIDVAAVRRQMGVVLQSSKLTAGSVYTNIVGIATVPMEEAWEAARLAGLDEDLQNMPMGMHTLVSEGGGSLSGGQRQRLLIARALVNRPRILFLDEATSALDNRIQAAVTERIGALHSTRVIIAHRLSTIRNADRIYVLDGGRVVQSGPFDHLISKPGLFAELAARQEA